MTTALSIVNRAAELIGYKDPAQALSGDDAASFLEALNSMIGTWNTGRLNVISTQAVTASVSASPVAIGAGQTLNTARPVSIQGAWIRQDGVDYPLQSLTSDEYDAISDKATTSTLPTCFFYSPDAPDGALYLWPVPAGAVSLHVRVMTQLSEFADLATEYDLATGYKRAMEYSLAEELAPGRRPIQPEIARHAFNARRSIKVANYEPLNLQGIGSRRFDIRSGE